MFENDDTPIDVSISYLQYNNTDNTTVQTYLSVSDFV